MSFSQFLANDSRREAAWVEFLELLAAYGLGDDEAGQRLVTTLYSNDDPRPVIDIDTHLNKRRRSLETENNFLWIVAVNHVKYPEAIEEVYKFIEDLTVATEPAGVRAFQLYPQLVLLAIDIVEQSPDFHTSFSNVVNNTFQQAWEVTATAALMAFLGYAYPWVIPLIQMFQKYQRAAATGDLDIWKIFRDTQRAGDDIGVGGNSFGQGFIEQSVDSIKEYIENILEEISEWIRDLVQSIVDNVSTLVENVVEYVEEVWQAITDTIEDIADDVGTYVSNIADSAIVSIESVIDSVIDYTQTAFADSVESVRSLIASVDEWVDDIALNLAREIEDIFNGVDALILTIQESLSETVDAIVGEVNSVTASIVGFAQEIPEVAENIKKDVLDFLEQQPERVIQAIEQFIGAPIREWLEKVGSSQDYAELPPTIRASIFEGQVAKNREEWSKLFNETLPTHPVLKHVFLLLTGVFVVFNSLQGVAQIQSNVITQEFARSTPTRLMADADVLVSILRGLTDLEDGIDVLRRSGYSDSDAKKMLALRRQLLPAGELLQQWLRGLLSEEEINEQLRWSGIAEDDIERLKQAAYFIPQPQDLITMAVREVFSPETAEKFGQFEDFPEDFAKYAAMQGVSEEWAKRYWAAHWGLPSPQMGFEMLHRGIINEEELQLLLKALDVMPFWRDRLIQLSYTPLTRVDVRRMHKVGVLDRDGVDRAYRDIGYSPENAARMVEFTERLNKGGTADDEDQLLNLSKAQVINAYKDGVLERERTRILLIELLHSPEAAGVLLDIADLEIDTQERKEEIALIIEQYKSGSLTFDEATTLITSIGLATNEQSKAIAELEKMERTKTKSPSKADLDKFRSAGLINDDEYLLQLERLGYSQLWANRYLSLLDLEGKLDA